MRDLRNEMNLEAPRCRGGYLEDAPEEIWENSEWVVEPKMDGQRITMQIGAEGSLLVGRNREDFLKGVARAKGFRVQNEVNPEMAAIACPDLDDTVLDGELTDVRKQDGSQDKMTLRRLEIGEFVGYAVWGALVVRGMDVRHLPDERRRDIAGRVIDFLYQNCPGAYDKIKLIERYPATKRQVEKFLDAGLEGAIAKNQTKPIPMGQRTNSWWWKIKADQNRTVDAFIFDATEAADGGSGLTDTPRKPNGKLASFVMAMLNSEGVKIEVAKCHHGNMDQEVVDRGWQFIDEYKGKVIEMQVSGWDGKAFRWPRFVRWRMDKGPEDCRFEEQVGKEAGGARALLVKS
jgi:ATP-dependent DNA ligase